MNHALSNLLRDAQACHEREPQNVPLIRDMCRALVAHQFEDAALP
jgi:hypothetical protein